MALRKHVTKRNAHPAKIGTGAVDQNDRRTRCVARSKFNHMQPAAGAIDHLALRRIDALKNEDADLRHQHQSGEHPNKYHQ